MRCIASTGILYIFNMSRSILLSSMSIVNTLREIPFQDLDEKPFVVWDFEPVGTHGQNSLGGFLLGFTF